MGSSDIAACSQTLNLLNLNWVIGAFARKSNQLWHLRTDVMPAIVFGALCTNLLLLACQSLNLTYA